MRIGQGVDAHRFSTDPRRPLVLGLVTIDGATGLDGHSDADVATHALCDALLGAVGLGDLGRHFSSSDDRWRGASSRTFLTHVCALVARAGWRVVNADLTIVAERPRLVDWLEEMASTLTDAVGAPVSVKATTTDALGALGRGEGIAATCVCLLEDA